MDTIRLFKAAAVFAAALFLAAAAVFAQGMPLDDKARYERSLENKVDAVLLRLLGPNQAQVVVQATMDFTRTEKVDMTSKAATTEAKENMFKWDSGSTENQMNAEYLLPGFPSVVGGSARPENTTYKKQMLFPETFIKQLSVTVILNKDLSGNEDQAVRNVVSEILSLDPGRGDKLVVMKTPFAPFWRTVWYTPESMGLVFKYGILTLMGIIAMIVVAIGFLKLAGAMNTMAKAQQGHQITMDLGQGAGGMMGGGGGGIEKIDMTIGDKKEKAAVGAEPEESEFFNVKPEQVDFLVNLMSGEDPANISLVAGHLPDQVRSDFLRKLPREVSAEVISNMAQMRFVEPDVINTIREELERRLAGAFGGVGKVIEALSLVNLKAKKEMLENLERRHPDIARAVRPRVFLPEDLLKFPEKDLSILATTVKIEDWALALWGFPPAFKEKLKKQLTEKTWAMLEQTMKYGSPSAEKSELAVESVVETALRLIREGRLVNPLSAAQAAQEVPAPAVAGPGIPPPPPLPPPAAEGAKI